MSDLAVAELRKALAKALLPPEDIKYSEWARRYFHLSGTSAAKGRFKPWKFQRGILDEIGNMAMPRVSIMKSIRTGYSVSLTAGIGATQANDPCPMILYLPREEDCRRFAVEEIEPAFDASPALRGLMETGRFNSRSTLTHRTMIGGGSLKILGANSPVNFRAHSARIVKFDELDAMKITPEGTPYELGASRIMGSPDGRIIAGSTPTGGQFSMINQLFDESDQRIFEVVCYECNDAFEMMWENVDWIRGKARTTTVVNCPCCGSSLEERFKPQMVEDGDWRSTKPEVEGHAGFRMNSLISLFTSMSWWRLAETYEEAERAGPQKMQVFFETRLGKVWSNSVDRVNEKTLMARAEDFGIQWDNELSRWRQDIPEAVAYITCGVDVQQNRLEATLVGHSPDNTYVLGHHVIYGDARLSATWDELLSFLQTEWKHPLGANIGVSSACVDSGDGNMTEQVYEFCERVQGSKIVAIKGVGGEDKKILRVSTGEKSPKYKRFRAPLYLVGVDQVKTFLMTGFPLENFEKQSIRFSNSLDEEWFSQLTSEQRETQVIKSGTLKGRTKIAFVPVGNRRHEALDCTVYGFAARFLLNINYEKRYQELRETTVNNISLSDIVGGIHE